MRATLRSIGLLAIFSVGLVLVLGSAPEVDALGCGESRNGTLNLITFTCPSGPIIDCTEIVVCLK